MGWTGSACTVPEDFASAGLESPLIADAALYVAAALEVFALVFCRSVVNFAARRMSEARSRVLSALWSPWQPSRSSPLEITCLATDLNCHGTHPFWFVTIASWGVFVRLEGKGSPSPPEHAQRSGSSKWGRGGRTGRRPRGGDDGVRFRDNTDFFYCRMAALEAELVGGICSRLPSVPGREPGVRGDAGEV